MTRPDDLSKGGPPGSSPAGAPAGAPADRLAGLSPAKRALLEQRLARPLTAPASAPATAGAPATRGAERIAIVAAACRFPGGAHTPEAFWQMLLEGRDAVTTVPTGRWDGEALFDADPLAPGRVMSRHGAFLDAVDGFDAGFFGVSPREAALMDPQQRLLLEVAWEALEAGGQAVDTLAGSATGVFVGAHNHSSDWWLLQLAQREGLESHAATGSAHSILANRLSYALDLRGPSMTVDTACSSSLVAVHLACQSLRTGECDLALAGGVNLMLLPSASLAFSKLQILSPNGRCRSFDASADGIVRGEGVGLVLLKRLTDALRDGDPVLAVVAGSAVNQDGASNGLTAPNGPAQEAVLKRALAMAGFGAERYGLVETHGTGTPLGDPVEVEALARVIGEPRGAQHRCWLGAVKTHIGHLEAAAGIAGLIKAVWCLREGLVPGNLHFTQPNPHLRLEGAALAIPTVAEAWAAGAQPRVAGVSSFGFGGTNAHVVLEEHRASADAPSSPAGAEPGDAWLPLSARDPMALAARLRATAQAARTLPEERRADLAHTLQQRRCHHAWRVAVHGNTLPALADRMQARAEQIERDSQAGSATDGGHADHALPVGSIRAAVPGGAVWVYTGQGGLWPGMARALHDSDAVFRAALVAVAAAFERRAGWDLKPALLDTGPEAEARLARTEVAQPALFALQVALTASWRALGLVPAAVVGHSVGEVAAAHAAGVLSLEEAVQVVHERSRAMQPAFDRGRMAQVGCAPDDLREALTLTAGRVSVSAHNGPRATVLAGAPEALETCLDALRARGIPVQPLAVQYAFHSAQMAPFVPAIEQALAGLVPRAPSCPLASTVTGRWAAAGEHDAAYWGRNVREPVRFAPVVAELLRAGYRHFLEIGPHPALGAGVLAQAEQMEAESADVAVGDIVVCASLRRQQGTRATLLASLATLYEAGVPLDHAALRDPRRPVVPLPAYPWQRRRHWLGAPDAAALAFGVTGRAPALAADLPAPPQADEGAACYEMRWRPSIAAPGPDGRAAFTPLPAGFFDPRRWLPTLMEGARGWPQAQALAREVDVHAGLEHRGRHWARQAVAALGFAPSEPFDLPSAQARGVHPRHARLWQRLVQMAAAAEPAAPGSPERAAQPPARTEAALMDRCGAQLAAVLRGEADPLQLLFPEDGRESAADVYARTPSAELYNRLAGETVRHLAAAAGRPLRVLEIGAGTGATAQRLLPVLPAGGQYCFTDVSPLFLHEAQARFGASAQVFSFRRLDIEQPPAGQGFDEGRFDLVVASNVLHATADLARALAHARSLLAPGGVLLLVETVARRAWADLSFGLTEGWWRFADAPLRREDALLAPQPWCTLLQQAGFEDAQAVGAEFSAHAVHAQALLLARRPHETGAAPKPATTAPSRQRRFEGTHWHLVPDRAGVAARLAAALEAEGAGCRIGPVEEIASSPLPGPNRVLYAASLDLSGAQGLPADPASAAFAFADFAAATALPAGVRDAFACASAVARRDASDMAPSGAACTREAASPTPRLWLLTRGAVSVGGHDTAPAAPLAAVLWGLGRSMALEHPRAWGGLIDLDTDLDTDLDPGSTGDGASRGTLDALLDALAASDGEDQMALRRGLRHVARLERREAPPPSALPDLSSMSPMSSMSTGSVLVTGGYGGLGLKIARWLAGQGARRIVLVGRRGAPAESTFAQGLDVLRARGVELVCERADVADLESMRALFERQADAGAPVRGIVHAAAAIRFAALASLQPADVAEALRAKVAGSAVLHELTRALPPEHALAFFVLFSSATSLLGAKGLAAYAAGNLFQGALAQWRTARGLPATCIDWGAWSEVRLLGDRGASALASLGLRPMDDAQAFARAASLVQAGVPACMVADVHWPTAVAAYQAFGRRPFLDVLAGPAAPATAADENGAGTGGVAPAASTPPRHGAPAGSLRDTLVALAPAARRDHMIQLVRQELARVLGLPGAQAVDAAKGLFELGLDSLMAMQLRRRLAEITKLELPATLTFNQPSVLPLAEHLLHRLGLGAPDTAVAADAAARAAQATAAAGSASTSTPPAAADSAVQDVAALSAEEVRAALRAELRAAGLDDLDLQDEPAVALPKEPR